MKPRIYQLAATLGLILAFALPAAAQSRIGVIDLRKVFDDYYKTRTADTTLKDRAADLDKERKTLIDEYQKASDDYKKALEDANNQAISADEREKRKKAAESKLLEIKEMEQRITEFDRKARTMLDEQQRRMRENILEEIRAVVNARAKAAGYSLILDTAAETINKTPVVMYSSGENDITEAVLSQLNTGAPAGSVNSPAGKK